MTWMLIRASGVIAYALLSFSAIWGLLLGGGFLGKRSTKSLTFAHESLSVGALIATILHMALLYADDYVVFELSELLTPGASDWRPIAVAFGVVAFYGLFIVVLSFYVRKLIGQRVWRGLHYSSFGIWLASLVHGILAGTDRTEPWLLWVYGSTAAAVAVLLAFRIRDLELISGSREDGKRSDANRKRIPAG